MTPDVQKIRKSPKNALLNKMSNLLFQHDHKLMFFYTNVYYVFTKSE
jgi:hypothetical protein